MTKRCHFKILILLFLISFLPRVIFLEKTTIYPDEISWMVRSKETVSALKRLNLGFFNNAWWHLPESAEAIGLPEVILSGTSMALIGKGQINFGLSLINEVVAARLPIAFLNSLLIPLFYLFAKKYFSTKASFIAAFLLAFDPIHLALSRWVMLDGVLTLFTFSAVYFFLFVHRKILKIFLASSSLAAAFLTKPSGILPILSWSTLVIFKHDDKKSYIKQFVLSILFFLLFVWIFWLGEWHQPIISMVDYVLRLNQFTQEGYSVFFLGTITKHPPFYYYLFQILSRLPLAIEFILFYSLLLFITQIFPLKIQKLKNRLFPLIPLFIFPICYLLLISFSALKLGVRYALPLWPWIYLIVAWGLQQVLLKQKSKFLITIFAFFLIITSYLTYQKYLPNFYLFYNSLIGGPGQAQQYDLVGHCIGTRKALDFININYPTIKSVAILGCSNVTAPYYFPGTITTNWRKESLVIIENTYEQLSGNNSSQSEVISYFKSFSPIFIAKDHEAVLSKVYLHQTSLSNTKPL